MGRGMGLVGVNVQREYAKIPLDPQLFKINVAKKHLDHLIKDDLDDISRQEVVYSILKD